MNLATCAMAAMTFDAGSLQSCFADWRRPRTAACARPARRRDRSAPPVRCQSHLLPAGTGKVVFMRLKQLVIAATPLARPAHCWADRCRVAAAAREMAADGWYQS